MRSKFVAIYDLYMCRYKTTKYHVWGRLVSINLGQIHARSEGRKSNLEFHDEVSYDYSTPLLRTCLDLNFSDEKSVIEG